MRSRLAMLVAVAVAVAAVAYVIIRLAPSPSGPAVAQASLPSSPASYLGVYEHGPPGNYRPDAEFTRAVGRQPNLVGYYSGWGERFRRRSRETVDEHGAVTIMQWDPTDVGRRDRRGRL